MITTGQLVWFIWSKSIYFNYGLKCR